MPQLDERPCLSVVVPCFNERTTVQQLVKRVLDSPWVVEVIVVDDGSNDGTRELLETLDDPRVRIELHDVNRGKGAALRAGFALAGAEYVVVQDADLEYDPAKYADLLGPLESGDADVVFGSRFVSNMATDLHLTDIETCYKAFRREVVQAIEIEEDRFGFEPEVTAKVAAAGVRIFEVGISYSDRTYADGKKIGWRDGARAAV